MKYILIFSIILATINANIVQDIILSSIKNIDVSKISEGCNKQLLAFARNLANGSNPWALRMLDATSKLQTGILNANTGELGNFDECLAAYGEDEEVGSIHGKYCLGYPNIQGIHPVEENIMAFHKLINNSKHITNTGPRIGVIPGPSPFSWAGCLPDACGTQDFQEVYNIILKSLNVGEIPFYFTDALCQTKESSNPDLTAGAITTICILGTVAIIMILETCYDVYCQYSKKEAKNPILVAFSVYTNWGKLVKVSSGGEQFGCLNGIRFYSMLWVVIGHTYLVGCTTFVTNAGAILEFADSLKSMMIVSGTLSVDSFFLVGGVLTAYGFFQAMSKGIKFNIIIYYLHRYIRLTPQLAIVALVSATLLPYLGSGPKYPRMAASLQEPCRNNWYATLFYYKTYTPADDFCVGQAWYLCVDMQLYILSPIFLFALHKYPKISIIAIQGLIIATMSGTFVISWTNDLSAILSNFLSSDRLAYMDKYYYKAHARATPWLMGLLLGHTIFSAKTSNKPFNLKKSMIWSFWIISLVILLLCVFIGHDTLRNVEDYDRWGNALHITFIRPVWSLALCWIIYACIFNYGGPINSILSVPIYQVLNRFTYCIYLTHLSFIYLWYATLRTPIYFSDTNMNYEFWGILAFSTFLSIPLILAFESPIIILEKQLFGLFRGNNKSNSKAKEVA